MSRPKKNNEKPIRVDGTNLHGMPFIATKNGKIVFSRNLENWDTWQNVDDLEDVHIDSNITDQVKEILKNKKETEPIKVPENSFENSELELDKDIINSPDYLYHKYVYIPEKDKDKSVINLNKTENWCLNGEKPNEIVYYMRHNSENFIIPEMYRDKIKKIMNYISGKDIDCFEEPEENKIIFEKKSGTSMPEQIIYYAMKQLYKDTINRFDGLGFEIDIYIKSLMLGIEYNGSYWHKGHEARDIFKKNCCMQRGINLITVTDNGGSLYPIYENGNISIRPYKKYEVEQNIAIVDLILHNVINKNYSIEEVRSGQDIFETLVDKFNN